MSERKQVGTVQVDSGEIAIVDPSLNIVDGRFSKSFDWVWRGNVPSLF